LSLIIGITVALTQAHRATVQARIANEQRDEAQRARERAEKTSRFMQSFLSYANPNWYGQGRGRTNVTVREAIDDAAGRIDTELADAPEVRADLHYTIGEIYRVSGESEIALGHFRQSLDLYRQVHGEQHPKVARGLYYLSIAIARGGLSTAEESQLLLRHGIAIMRRTDPNNVNLPYMLQSLADWIMEGERQSRSENRLAEAESLILEAKTLFIRHYGENHLATITADSNLATLALTRGDLARAESLAEENLRRFRQTDEGGYNHIWASFYLAEAKLALGKETEAETLFGQALELGRRQWGANDFRFERLVRDIGQARRATSK